MAKEIDNRSRKPAPRQGPGVFTAFGLAWGEPPPGQNPRCIMVRALPEGSLSCGYELIWNIESPDVQGDFTRLQGAGATVVREPYNFAEAPDMWIATFADPDDNYFQLMSPMGPDQPG